MPEAVTRGLRVRVEAEFVPESSDLDRAFYYFRYTVTLINEGREAVQLLSRHWIIMDGDGTRQDVRGPGVVGEQPTLEPGEQFTYSSFCPLRTPSGFMRGSYQMRTQRGDFFEAEIPAFSLANPLDVA